jgi:hypothetical protein
MRLSSCLCLVILIAGLVTGVPAQTIFGTILGTVTDATGAVVADVQIRVVDVNTNIERRTITDNLGKGGSPLSAEALRRGVGTPRARAKCTSASGSTFSESANFPLSC